jgi:hypothetical protein
MSTGTAVGIESRVLNEGYGSGAWHGPDLKAALADVSAAEAFWRPAAGRHNIAEIVLHHAYVVRSVSAQLSGKAAEPFILEGEDWFEVSDENTLSWSKMLSTLDSQQQKLSALVADIESGAVTSPMSEAERFGLVLGVTCHAVYHAGQIQLIKRLRS